MRVEFVGLPAAGKTSACRAALADLDGLGIPARLDGVEEWRADRRGLAADYLRVAARAERRVSAPWGAAWLLRCAVGRGGQRAVRSWGACAYAVAVDTHVRGLDPGAVWLHDQATVQALWSVSMRTGIGAAAVAAGFGSRVAWPDIVVEVRAPLPTITDRLRQRPRLPASLADHEGGRLSDALRTGQRAFEDLREVAAGESVPWLRPDDAASVGPALAGHIRGRAPGSSHPRRVVDPPRTRCGSTIRGFMRVLVGIGNRSTPPGSNRERDERAAPSSSG